MTIRVPWTPTDNDVIGSAVAGSLSFDDLFDLMPHRTFAALRRRYTNFGKPDAEIRHYRAMAIGSAALLRAMLREVRHGINPGSSVEA